MFGNSLASGHYARGTRCAEIGLLVTAAYYVHAWRNLESAELPNTPDTRVLFGRHSWPELRCLQWGVCSSVFLFMLAGAADTESDWLFRLVGALMGFCAAVCFGLLFSHEAEPSVQCTWMWKGGGSNDLEPPHVVTETYADFPWGSCPRLRVEY